MMKPAIPPTPQPQLTYVDRPEIAEVFAHAPKRFSFDGANLHIEFVVNRFNDPELSKAQTGQSITAARLVMPLQGIADLQTQLAAFMQTLQGQGAINAVSPVPHTLN